jgi:hypothetical protein
MRLELCVAFLMLEFDPFKKKVIVIRSDMSTYSNCF